MPFPPDLLDDGIDLDGIDVTGTLFQCHGDVGAGAGPTINTSSKVRPGNQS